MGCLLPLGRSGCVGCAGCLLPLLLAALCLLTPLSLLRTHHHGHAASRPLLTASRPRVPSRTQSAILRQWHKRPEPPYSWLTPSNASRMLRSSTGSSSRMRGSGGVPES